MPTLTNDYIGQNCETSLPEVKQSSRKRRHKRAQQNGNYAENLVDTDVTISNPLVATDQFNSGDYTSSHGNASTYPLNMSERRERYADKRLTKMSNTSEDTENIKQTRRRRKVKSARKLARSPSKEVMELEDRNKQSINCDVTSDDGNTENRDKESNVDQYSGRKSRGHGRHEKRRRDTSTYKHESYHDDEEFNSKYCLDLEDILQPADLNHSSTRFIGGHVMPQLRSQQTDVVYVEKKGKRGFINEDKDKSKILTAPEKSTHVIDVVQKGTLHFILKIHLGFRSFSLMIHGLLAGLALSQLVFVYTLSKDNDKILLEMYHELALPYHCMYYFLLAICNVSIFDRYINISSGWRQFFSVLVRKPSRAFALIFYVFALVFSTGLAQLDNRISMYTCMPHLWTKNVSKHLAVWKIINLLRVVGSVLGWIMVCLAPNLDETTASIEEKLKKGESDKASMSNGRTSILQNSTTIVTWDGIKS